MDTKNVIAAISLSAAVIIIYGLFFAPNPDLNIRKNSDQNVKKIEQADTPSIEVVEKVSNISRSEAISKNKRIKFENESIAGTINLKGAIIDDLTFKKYTETLNGSDNVVLLNPKNIEKGYYVETGWVTNNKNISLPDSNSIWKIDGNKILSPNNSIKLYWSNDEGIKFNKTISLDNNFLFTIEQNIINDTNKTYNFYPYGQIIRNTAPEVTNFYILHEGLIGVFDEQLVEEDYDDIEEKKYSINATSGWTGITDKFWTTIIVPESNKEFRSDYEYKNKFKANFIETKPTEVGANESKKIPLN